MCDDKYHGRTALCNSLQNPAKDSEKPPVVAISVALWHKAKFIVMLVRAGGSAFTKRSSPAGLVILQILGLVQI